MSDFTSGMSRQQQLRLRSVKTAYWDEHGQIDMIMAADMEQKCREILAKNAFVSQRPALFNNYSFIECTHEIRGDTCILVGAELIIHNPMVHEFRVRPCGAQTWTCLNPTTLDGTPWEPVPLRGLVRDIHDRLMEVRRAYKDVKIIRDILEEFCKLNDIPQIATPAAVKEVHNVFISENRRIERDAIWRMLYSYHHQSRGIFAKPATSRRATLRFPGRNRS